MRLIIVVPVFLIAGKAILFELNVLFDCMRNVGNADALGISRIVNLHLRLNTRQRFQNGKRNFNTLQINLSN